jgi:hypothetical protein
MPARLTADLPDAAACCLVRSRAPLTLGRGADCGFRIDHPSVSRAHAVLTQHDGRWRLEDSGSKNGSFVDEARVAATELGDHAWFRLGDVFCELRALSEQAADQAEVRMVEKRATSRFLVEAIERQTSLGSLLAQTVRATVELADCDRGARQLQRPRLRARRQHDSRRLARHPRRPQQRRRVALRCEHAALLDRLPARLRRLWPPGAYPGNAASAARARRIPGRA